MQKAPFDAGLRAAAANGQLWNMLLSLLYIPELWLMPQRQVYTLYVILVDSLTNSLTYCSALSLA